jgi:DNA invertase Pin-like site-specific DNA recombinase
MLATAETQSAYVENEMTAIGYVRQSRRADLDVAMSPDQQRADVATLAQRDGLDPSSVRVLEDLGRSGKAGKKKYPGYGAMLSAIEGGGVSTIYAKALSRLGRSRKEMFELADLCLANGTRIVTMKEGVMDPTTPIGKVQFSMLTAFNEFERDLAVERARDNVATRRANGERMGRLPYGEADGEDPQAVADAYLAAGSMNGAALALNRAGVPSPLGRSWSGTGVRLVLHRRFPGLLPKQPKKGARSSSGFALYRLLHCACGRVLTASRDGRGNREPVYRCHAARTLPGHAPAYRVRESQVMPTIRAEVDSIGAAIINFRTEDDSAVRREGLERERENLGWAVVKGLIPRDKAEVRAKAISAELEALADTDEVMALDPRIGPLVDFDAPPGEVNKALGALLRAVRMDERMGVAGFEWRGRWAPEDAIIVGQLPSA